MITRMLLTAAFAAHIVLAQAAAPAASAEQEHTDRVVRFKELDKNGDGKISLLEFQTRPNHANVVAGKPSPPPTDKEMADRAVRFKQLDLNHDGFLDFKEFEATMTTPQPGR